MVEDEWRTLKISDAYLRLGTNPEKPFASVERQHWRHLAPSHLVREIIPLFWIGPLFFLFVCLRVRLYLEELYV